MDVLLDRLTAIQGGDEAVPRVVVLTAESGAGKSRVVREVYERLRAQQPVAVSGHGYWPDLSIGHAGQVAGREAMPTRKILGPAVADFQRPAGALPSFFWWPVACDQMPDGSMVDVVQLLRPQVEAHFPFLAEAWRQRSSTTQKVQAWATREAPGEARALGAEGGIEAIGAVLDAANAVAPGLGWALTRSVRGARAFRQRRLLKASVAAGGELVTPDRAAEAIFEQLTRVMHPDLPTVVVIEDMHLMGEGLADLLDYLAQPAADKPVLVIGTAWPEALGHRPVYDRWLTAATSGQYGQPLAEVVALTDLDGSSLKALARRYAPHTDDQTLTMVAARWRNPNALVLAMTDARMQDFVTDGALRVSREELERVPRTVEDLYQRRWDELPELVRQALMLAVGCLPVDSSSDPELWPFIHGVVSDAAARSGVLDDPPAVAAALGAAVDPHEWAKHVAGAIDMDRFGEWILARIARRNFNDRYSHKDLPGAARAAISDWILATARTAGGYWLDLDDPLTIAGSRWALALIPGGDPSHSEAVGIAALTVARTQAAAFEYAAALITLSPDRIGALGPDRPDTLRARGSFALWYGQAGRLDQASGLLEGLLNDMVRLLGRDHPDTLAARNNLAVSLGRAGRIEQAVDQLTALLTDQVRVLGPDDPQTLIARKNLAVWHSRAGRIDEATGLLAALLDDMIRVLGAEHSETLRVRGDIASGYMEAGRADEAIELFEVLLEDQIRVMGCDHPDTLGTRHRIALWHGQAGRADEAIELFEVLLDDQIRVMGCDHPDTLSTRHDIASMQRGAGRAQVAIALQRALLGDMVRVMGPLHPHTLSTRHNIASAYMEVGRADEAIRLYRELLGDQIRVFGPDHPDTLATRHGIAMWHGQEGRIDEAIGLLWALLDDQTRVLGPRHPRTLRTRSDIAFGNWEAGRADEALELFEALLPDLVQVFGPDHQHSLAARKNIASLSGQVRRWGNETP